MNFWALNYVTAPFPENICWFPRRLEDVFNICYLPRRLQYVLEDQKLLAEGIFKIFRWPTKFLLGRNIYMYLANPKLYVTNLYLTYLYLTKLRRIETNSRWINKNLIISIFIRFRIYVLRFKVSGDCLLLWNQLNEIN